MRCKAALIIAVICAVVTNAYAGPPATKAAASTGTKRAGQSALPDYRQELEVLRLARADRLGDVDSLFGDGTQQSTVVVYVSDKCPCSRDYEGRLARLARDFPRVRFVRVYAFRDGPVDRIRQRATAFSQASARATTLFDFDQYTLSTLEPEATPEAFVFDPAGKLRYRGRIDDSQDEKKIKRHDLRDALRTLSTGKALAFRRTEPMGCSITRLSGEERKWNMLPPHMRPKSARPAGSNGKSGETMKHD